VNVDERILFVSGNDGCVSVGDGSPTSEKDRLDNGGPQTEVALSQSFWLGKTEVTQSQWESITGNSPSRFKGNAVK
jgi:formylglycine-generating enzyme required for sulfatase activity